MYKPSNSKVTLSGDEVKQLCNHAPVFIVLNNEIYVVDCVTQELSTTYLIAGKKLGNWEGGENFGR